MNERDKEKDLQDLARGLDELTEEGGPLVRLICEVRKSNELALRNVRLQFLSLAFLFMCLVCLIFLSFIFYQGLEKLITAEAHLVDITAKLVTMSASVGEMKSEVEEAPKIVADDSGKLKVVATVKLDETFTQERQSLQRMHENNDKLGEHLDSTQKHLKDAIDLMSAGAPPAAEKKPALKVEIPIDVNSAAEADD